MKNHSELWTAGEATVFAICMGCFFFDIVGVFGLAFAITGMLIAIGLVLAICLKRPLEDQVR
jgi:Na+/H+-translocating membrane pyrophosphatase